MNENQFIEHCKEALIKKFGLNGNLLQERDFEFLHERILDITQVDISTATLRRIWANKYQNAPQISTLDALARTLDYDGWHQFKIENATEPISSNSSLWKYLWILVLATLLVAAWVLIPWKNGVDSSGVQLIPEMKIHMGVPATIGFQYNLTGIENEAVIQLSWNPNEQSILDPQKNFYTGTYFYPDYHEAKIIVNGEIIVSDKVHITTEGWHGLLMKSGFDPRPVFLSEPQFVRRNSMLVSDSIVNSLRITYDKTYYPVFTLSNPDLDSLTADNLFLSFDARLHDTNSGLSCRYIDVLVKGSYGNVRIPLSQTGCYGLTQATVSEKTYSGKTYDLSGLSSDLSRGILVNLSIIDGRLTAHLHNGESFNLDYEDEIGRLKVIKFVLTGPGEIFNFKMRSADN